MVKTRKETKEMNGMNYNAFLFAGVAGLLTWILIVSSMPWSALIITNLLLALIAGQLTNKTYKK